MAKNVSDQITEKAMRDESYRRDLVSNPRKVLEQELKALKADASLPKSVEVRVVVQEPNTVYIFLPESSGGPSAHEASALATDEVTDSWVSVTFGTRICKCV